MKILLTLDLFEFAIYLDNGFWVDGCLVLKLSFEDFRILFRYSEQVFGN